MQVVVFPVLQRMKLYVEDFPKYSTKTEDMTKVTYESAVGSLMYAMVCTRLDIVQAVGVLNKFMANPGRSHWDAMKSVFRYLKATS